MKVSLKSKIEIKKNRLKRRSGTMLRETVKVFVVIGIASVLAFCMVYAYNFVIINPYFQLDSATVRGCDKVNEETILEIAGIVPSMNILTMNLDKIKRRIKSNPWVEDVFAGRELPNRIVVEIVEKDAAAIIKKNEKLYIVDWHGEVFKELQKGDTVDLPLLTGFYEGNRLRRGLLKEGLKLLRDLSLSGVFPGTVNVSEIIGDSVYGFTLVTNDRLLLELGFDNYKKKLRRLAQIVMKLDKRNSNGVFFKINLTDISRVVVSPVVVPPRRGLTNI
jgi:cell division protein FtsQ